MVRLYICDCERFLDSDEERQALELIPSFRRNVALKMKTDLKRAQSLAGGYVFAKAFMDEGYTITELDKLEIEINSQGKPYLRDRKDLFYNLSHSGNVVILGISDKEIGVDVEEIKEYKAKIAKRFFHQDEYEYLSCLDDEMARETFYRIWTLKESYIKAMGEGLSYGLNSFSFEIKNGSLNGKLVVSTSDMNWNFWDGEVVEGYKMAVCAKDNSIVEIIRV